MKNELMKLQIFKPSGVFCVEEDVLRLVLEATNGSLGLLPHRHDCLVVLAPGILFYQTKLEGEKFIGVDGGILVKTGFNVMVSVRQAIGGRTLDELHKAVNEEFKSLNIKEEHFRKIIAKVESRFIRSLVEVRNDR